MNFYVRTCKTVDPHSDVAVIHSVTRVARPRFQSFPFDSLPNNGLTKVSKVSLTARGVTIRYPHDTIRIAILGSRYDTYRDTW